MGEHHCYSCSFVCGTYTSISANEIKDQLLHQTFWLDKKGWCFFLYINSDQKCTIHVYLGTLPIYCYLKYTTRANQESAVVDIMFVAAVTSQIYYLGRHSEPHTYHESRKLSIWYMHIPYLHFWPIYEWPNVSTCVCSAVGTITIRVLTRPLADGFAVNYSTF